MKLKQYFTEKQEEMLSLIEKLVNIDSGSYDKQGIDQVGAILQKEYEQIGFHVTVHESDQYGNTLSIKHKDAGETNIIIVAHMDTVFPDGTAKQRPFSRDEKRAYGPGVIDMKASQVQVLYIMKGLIEMGSDAYKNVQIVLNSDEEIGSVSSRPIIEKLAADKKYALIVEPGRADHSIVSQRKGGGRFTLTVHGKAAHSGIEPEKGRSAVEELAHKIIKIHALTNYEEGLTLNAGLIEGGTSVNTVAPFATAHIDVRVVTQEQAEYVTKAVEEICSKPDVEGTRVELTGSVGRPPMFLNEQSESLLKVIKQAALEYGVTLKDTKTGGGSDGNFTSALGVATIDGLGPVGGSAHSEHEYLELETLVERSLVLAETIKKLS
ncbi:M20 family metallopeptidase [Bacillus horti]|uniref:Glutamate carboxypeptidase n=1 Tax=Caldalkalibacillus horti TaxID=77523 RepID=A0ABT9W2B7_9BACI|nr:M20 family metallopeptidase [Bacillus horti]MDQ0167395.1 glutamate carboxypeptidase [Bacillus horti]